MSYSFALSDSPIDRLVAATADVFAVETVRRPTAEPIQVGRLAADSATVELHGRLLVPPEQAYDILASRFRALHHIPLLRRTDDGEVVVAVPGEMPRVGLRYGLALGLFLLTTISVLSVGAGFAGAESPFDLLAGVPFAASLLGILVAHELGHFFVARRLGVPVSPPYFIPFPMSLLGTLGAVVRMAAPPRNRRALFAVAVAGPIAGLVITLPVLVVGLLLSPVQSVPLAGPIIQEGNSIFYAVLKYLIFGRWLPSGGVDVFLHPMAMAGWTGLLVTGLNLIPAGQLDGGHVAYALMGERSRWLGGIVVVVLLGLSVLWQGWLLWAGLAFFLGRTYAVPFDDITPLSKSERALAVAMFVIFLAIFTPNPLVIH